SQCTSAVPPPSLHDALPICAVGRRSLRDGLSGKAPDADDQGECDRNRDEQPTHETASVCRTSFPPKTVYGALIVLLFALLIIERSEEHTSALESPDHVVRRP